MNKGDLITKMANDASVSKAQAARALDSFLTTTMTTVKGGDKVTLVGFGTFSRAHRAARTGRNPQTGATINIPARNVPKFSPGKEFKSKV